MHVLLTIKKDAMHYYLSFIISAFIILNPNRGMGRCCGDGIYIGKIEIYPLESDNKGKKEE